MSQTKQEIIGTPLAGLGYVMLSFCSFTDGNLSKEELGQIGSEIRGIAKAWEHDEAAYDQAIEDALTMNEGCPTNSDKLELFKSILDVLVNQEWFTQGMCNGTVASLTRLMDADGVRHENEVYWIDTLKDAWKVA